MSNINKTVSFIILSTEKFLRGYRRIFKAGEFLHDAEIHIIKHRFYAVQKLVEAEGYASLHVIGYGRFCT